MDCAIYTCTHIHVVVIMILAIILSFTTAVAQVWNYKQKRCLFTLLGHLDYIRTTFFHKARISIHVHMIHATTGVPLGGE